MKTYRVIWGVSRDAIVVADSKKEAEEKVLLGEVEAMDLDLIKDPKAELLEE